jgi:hypothetical protein
MKALLVIVAIVAVLALIGWITFGTGDDRASLSIETDKIRQDTREAVEEGGEFIEGARQEIREELRDDETDAPAADPRRETTIERESQEPVREGTSWTRPGLSPRPMESLRV